MLCLPRESHLSELSQETGKTAGWEVLMMNRGDQNISASVHAGTHTQSFCEHTTSNIAMLWWQLACLDKSVKAEHLPFYCDILVISFCTLHAWMSKMCLETGRLLERKSSLSHRNSSSDASALRSIWHLPYELRHRSFVPRSLLIKKSEQERRLTICHQILKQRA